MSLRSKIILVLVAVVVLFVGVDNVVQRVLVRNSFRAVEREQALTDLERVVDTFRSSAASMADTVARGLSSGTGLDAGLVATLDLDLAYVCEPGGLVLDAWLSPPPPGGATRLREFPGEALSPDHPMLRAAEGLRPLTGWIQTERGLMLVAATRSSTRAGDVVAIVGRLADAEAAREIGRLAHVRFDVHPLEHASGPTSAWPEQPGTFDGPRLEYEDDWIHTWRVLNDARGVPALMLQVRTERTIDAAAARTADYGLMSSLGAAVMILGVLLVLLRTIVTGPLGRLTEHAVAIGASDDLYDRLEAESARTDEIGVLAREFDRTMDRLAESREELMRASRLAGMSEVSSEVLHNIGNVLNSVKTSLGAGLELIERGAQNDLERVVEELQRHSGDLEAFLTEGGRGEKLVQLLAALQAQLCDERSRIVAELRRLGGGVQRIGELVQSQERYAESVDVLEWCHLADELERVLHLCGADSGPSAPNVVREYADLPRMRVDRHRLTEILVPVVHNGLQAIEDSRGSGGHLSVRLIREGTAALVIEVEDDGVGIEPGRLQEVFQGGYSTRSGALGMGLHVAANRAVEMGGSLTAASEGPGEGALLRIRLPLHGDVVRAREEAAAQAPQSG